MAIKGFSTNKGSIVVPSPDSDCIASPETFIKGIQTFAAAQQMPTLPTVSPDLEGVFKWPELDFSFVTTLPTLPVIECPSIVPAFPNFGDLIKIPNFAFPKLNAPVLSFAGALNLDVLPKKITLSLPTLTGLTIPTIDPTQTISKATQ